MPEQLKVASFFSGIGAFDLGFERAGMRVVFQCEKNRFCQQVLKTHWPGIPPLDNITAVDPHEIPDADVWCGGPPCQDISKANQGRRRGFAGERSGLFYAYAALYKIRKPKWIVIENVPDLLTFNRGGDFKVLLQSMDELGYGISWRVLDAKYFGTPQRRRRLFIVASLGSLRSKQVLFESESVAVVHRAGIGKRDYVAPSAAIGIGMSDYYVIQHAAIGRQPAAGPQAKGYRNDGETWTLDSRGSGDVVCSTVDAFGVREVAGIPGKLDAARYKSIGNSVYVPICEWIGNRIVTVNNQNK